MLLTIRPKMWSCNSAIVPGTIVIELFMLFFRKHVYVSTLFPSIPIRIAETRGLFNLLQSPACIHMIADWPVMQESIRIGPGTHARTTNRDKD